MQILQGVGILDEVLRKKPRYRRDLSSSNWESVVYRTWKRSKSFKVLLNSYLTPLTRHVTLDFWNVRCCILKYVILQDSLLQIFRRAYSMILNNRWVHSPRFGFCNLPSSYIFLTFLKTSLFNVMYYPSRPVCWGTSNLITSRAPYYHSNSLWNQWTSIFFRILPKLSKGIWKTHSICVGEARRYCPRAFPS